MPPAKRIHSTGVQPMTDPTLSLRRRQLLAGGAGALAGSGLLGLAGEAAAQAAAPAASAAAAGARPLPAYVAWKDANAVIVHSATTIETKRSAFGTSGITPAEQLYIRNNLPAPDASIVANREAWQVSIEGVRNPRTLSVADLKTIGVETVASVLQCSGNGRGYFPSKPSGTPWTVGAAGCVLWSGVPLRHVVEALGGVAPGMVFLTGTGGEKLPENVDPLSVMVERSVPVKALADAMLAWEMNGAPLPLAHGGPLRLIVPGYNGVNNIKYVKRVAFTTVESQAKIMTTGYRITPLGEQSKASEPSVQELNVKSFVTSPAGDRSVKAGVVYVTGVAFSAGAPIRRVEVSSDGGRSWIDVPFTGPDLGRFAWRQFAMPLRMATGNYVVVSRATDSAGNVQPEQRAENAHGYSNNSWKDPAVMVSVV
jgi:sulfite oxidase